MNGTGHAESGERWAFAYGSLMWKPGFRFVERRPALLHGRRRAFCLYSVHHRGTKRFPGLMLGLAPGGSVRGVAYRVEKCDWPEIYAYLCERELLTGAYVEDLARVRLDDGRKISSLIFLPNRAHSQWAGDLSLERKCQIIAAASGVSGRNFDYLKDLVHSLKGEGIRDRRLELLLALVEEPAV